MPDTHCCSVCRAMRGSPWCRICWTVEVVDQPIKKTHFWTGRVLVGAPMASRPFSARRHHQAGHATALDVYKASKSVQSQKQVELESACYQRWCSALRTAGADQDPGIQYGSSESESTALSQFRLCILPRTIRKYRPNSPEVKGHKVHTGQMCTLNVHYFWPI